MNKKKIVIFAFLATLLTLSIAATASATTSAHWTVSTWNDLHSFHTEDKLSGISVYLFYVDGNGNNVFLYGPSQPSVAGMIDFDTDDFSGVTGGVVYLVGYADSGFSGLVRSVVPPSAGGSVSTYLEYGAPFASSMNWETSTSTPFNPSASPAPTVYPTLPQQTTPQPTYALPTEQPTNPPTQNNNPNNPFAGLDSIPFSLWFLVGCAIVAVAVLSTQKRGRRGR